jgi:hypothetical protein
MSHLLREISLSLEREPTVSCRQRPVCCADRSVVPSHPRARADLLSSPILLTNRPSAGDCRRSPNRRAKRAGRRPPNSPIPSCRRRGCRRSSIKFLFCRAASESAGGATLGPFSSPLHSIPEIYPSVWSSCFSLVSTDSFGSCLILRCGFDPLGSVLAMIPWWTVGGKLARCCWCLGTGVIRGVVATQEFFDSLAWRQETQGHGPLRIWDLSEVGCLSCL